MASKRPRMILGKPVLLIAGTGFVLILLYLAIVSTPTPLPSGVTHDLDGAEAACTEVLKDREPGAFFPFGATAIYLGDATYRLDGTVDARTNGETVRRNYECYVSYTESGGYRTDSLTLWQSH